MSEIDEIIRSRARMISATQERELSLAQQRRIVQEKEARARDERRRHELQVAARLEQQQADEIFGLIGRFTVWAEDNGIEQNSPSKKTRGWVLGSRQSRPAFSSGVDSSYITDWSKRLLVARPGPITFEIYDHYSTKWGAHPSISPKWYYNRKPYGEGANAVPLPDNLLEYEIGASYSPTIKPLFQYGLDQIVNSIVSFSAESGIVWDNW